MVTVPSDVTFPNFRRHGSPRQENFIHAAVDVSDTAEQGTLASVIDLTNAFYESATSIQVAGFHLGITGVNSWKQGKKSLIQRKSQRIKLCTNVIYLVKMFSWLNRNGFNKNCFTGLMVPGGSCCYRNSLVFFFFFFVLWSWNWKLTSHHMRVWSRETVLCSA